MESRPGSDRPPGGDMLRYQVAQCIEEDLLLHGNIGFDNLDENLGRRDFEPVERRSRGDVRLNMFSGQYQKHQRVLGMNLKRHRRRIAQEYTVAIIGSTLRGERQLPIGAAFPRLCQHAQAAAQLRGCMARERILACLHGKDGRHDQRHVGCLRPQGRQIIRPAEATCHFQAKRVFPGSVSPFDDDGARIW
mgnify:CR=1 FL=1